MMGTTGMKRSIITCITFLLLITLAFGGCSGDVEVHDNRLDEYQAISNGLNTELPDPINLAGWIVISEGRLYLDEARVYIADLGMGDDDPFIQHEGENIIRMTAEIANEFLERHGSMVGGHEIFSLDNDIVSFELTDETIFTFYDTSFFFIQTAPPRYSTNAPIEFLMHRLIQLRGLDNVYYGGHRLYCLYGGTVQMSPEYFLLRDCRCAYLRRTQPIVIVRVQGDKVVSVTEEFLFTQ